MADDTDQDGGEYPFWGRALLALICFGASLGIGWTFTGVSGLIAGGLVGLGLALFAFLAPGVLVGIFTVLEILSSCS